MSPCKIIFCDIDGTLLTSDHTISPDTIRRIRALCDAGILFIPVSSRMPDGIRPVLRLLGLCTPIISYGGSLILDAGGSPLFQVGMRREQAESLLEALPLSEPEFAVGIYSGDLWFSPDAAHPRIRREEEITSVSCRTGSLSELVTPDGQIHKLLCFGPPALLDQILPGLKEKFEGCNLCKSAPNLLEIMDASACKSRAIHFYLNKLGISPQNAAAFGDNYNDLDMLGAVGISTAMGNAPDEIKKAATYVTADNDHEGLLLALNRIFGKL